MTVFHFMEQWPSGQGAGFPIIGSRVKKYWVAPRSTQPFILPRLIKWVPEISGNLVVKNKLLLQGGCVTDSSWYHYTFFFYKQSIFDLAPKTV